jgi:hypothetical protein
VRKKLNRPRYSASPSANWAIKVCEPDQANCSAQGRQTTEVAIAAASLNRMLKLGRPEYVRLK